MVELIIGAGLLVMLLGGLTVAEVTFGKINRRQFAAAQCQAAAQAQMQTSSHAARDLPRPTRRLARRAAEHGADRRTGPVGRNETPAGRRRHRDRRSPGAGRPQPVLEERGDGQVRNGGHHCSNRVCGDVAAPAESSPSAVGCEQARGGFALSGGLSPTGTPGLLEDSPAPGLDERPIRGWFLRCPGWRRLWHRDLGGTGDSGNNLHPYPHSTGQDAERNLPVKYGDWHLGDRPVSVGTGQTTKLRGIFRRGTSLIELIVVMGMIGMLLTLAATLDRSAWSEPPRKAAFLPAKPPDRRHAPPHEGRRRSRLENADGRGPGGRTGPGQGGSVTYRQTGVAVKRRSERPDGKQISDGTCPPLTLSGTRGPRTARHRRWRCGASS